MRVLARKSSGNLITTCLLVLLSFIFLMAGIIVLCVGNDQIKQVVAIFFVASGLSLIPAAIVGIVYFKRPTALIKTVDEDTIWVYNFGEVKLDQIVNVRGNRAPARGFTYSFGILDIHTVNNVMSVGQVADVAVVEKIIMKLVYDHNHKK